MAACHAHSSSLRDSDPSRTFCRKIPWLVPSMVDGLATAEWTWTRIPACEAQDTRVWLDTGRQDTGVLSISPAL